MSNFAALEKLKVTEENTEKYYFEFEGVSKSPWVECRPATKQNRKYTSAVLSDPLMKKIALGQNLNGITDADAEKSVDKFIGVFVDHVIVSWGDMDEITTDARCSRKNKISFLKALIDNADYVWDEFAAWTQNPRNFVKIDAEEKAKN